MGNESSSTKDKENITKDNNKDRKIIVNSLKRMKERGTDIKEFLWELMLNENENENKNEEKENKDDEKGNISSRRERISQLTDTKHEQMCRYGHGSWGNRHDKIGDSQCVMCASLQGRAFCVDCYWYDRDRIGAPNKNDIIASCTYCKKCRDINAKTIKNSMKMDRFKASIIRDELINNPSLEMDLLCNMPRRASLDTLIIDINRLEPVERARWCLFLFDLDHLKAWNTCLGHVNTDIVIQKIGDIMKRYVTAVNDGKWRDEEKGELNKSMVYRIGGDEFIIAIRSGVSVHLSKLGMFYESIKRDINNLGSNIKELIFYKNGNFNENEWNDIMEKLNKAKDRNGNKINMQRVEVSTGIYVACPDVNVEKDWLSKADRVALEKAKTMNALKKNNVAIYYEKIGCVVPAEKVLKCLEKGIFDGLK